MFLRPQNGQVGQPLGSSHENTLFSNRGAGEGLPPIYGTLEATIMKTGRTTLHRELISFRLAVILFYVSQLGASSLAGGACGVCISAFKVSPSCGALQPTTPLAPPRSRPPGLE